MASALPFASASSLPLPVLENIAFHLVCAPLDSPTQQPGDDDLRHPYLYGPPAELPPCLPLSISRLPALLCVNRHYYAALSPGIVVSSVNGEEYPLQTELYARLCAYFLDTKAVGRRWRYPKRRKTTDDGDNWDRDLRSVTNEGLTAHLVQVCRALRFYRMAAREFGIPLPPQASHDAAAARPANPKLALFYPGIEQVLTMTVVLMMENDGLNHHQLRLVSAPLFIDMLVHHRLNEKTGSGLNHSARTVDPASGMDVLYNDGWPVENVLNTASLWAMWLFTTEEKIATESDAVRARLISLVLPFVLVPYRVSPLFVAHLDMSIFNFPSCNYVRAK